MEVSSFKDKAQASSLNLLMNMQQVTDEIREAIHLHSALIGSGDFYQSPLRETADGEKRGSID